MSEMTSADLKTLERTPLFQTLPRRHRKRVAELATVKRYGNDEVLVRQGDPGGSFIVMLSGDVLVTPSAGGERLVVSDEYFGELSLIDGEPRAATVSAAGPVKVACIDRKAFRQLLGDEPTLAAGLLPGVALIARDLLRADAEALPDHGQVGEWRSGGDSGEPTEAAGEKLEGRDALGWLLLLRHVGVFEALNEQHLRRVASLFTIERYADGDTVVLAGAPRRLAARHPERPGARADARRPHTRPRRRRLLRRTRADRRRTPRGHRHGRRRADHGEAHQIRLHQAAQGRTRHRRRPARRPRGNRARHAAGGRAGGLRTDDAVRERGSDDDGHAEDALGDHGRRRFHRLSGLRRRRSTIVWSSIHGCFSHLEVYWEQPRFVRLHAPARAGTCASLHMDKRGWGMSDRICGAPDVGRPDGRRQGRHGRLRHGAGRGVRLGRDRRRCRSPPSSPRRTRSAHRRCSSTVAPRRPGRGPPSGRHETRRTMSGMRGFASRSGGTTTTQLECAQLVLRRRPGGLPCRRPDVSALVDEDDEVLVHAHQHGRLLQDVAHHRHSPCSSDHPRADRRRCAPGSADAERTRPAEHLSNVQHTYPGARSSRCRGWPRHLDRGPGALRVGSGALPCIGQRRAGRARPHARDRALHRHRRLDGEGLRARRPQVDANCSSGTTRSCARCSPDTAATEIEHRRRRLPCHLRRPGAGGEMRAGGLRGGQAARPRGPRRLPHRRDRTAGRRRRRHRRAHRRPRRRARRTLRGPGQLHRQGPRRRLRASSSRTAASTTLKGVPEKWRLYAALPVAAADRAATNGGGRRCIRTAGLRPDAKETCSFV